MKLEIGQAYIVSKEAPLMPSHSPPDFFAALKEVKQIPKGGIIKIIETVQKNSRPWYKVVVLNQKKKRIGKGWINSTALLGQELKAFD